MTGGSDSAPLHLAESPVQGKLVHLTFCGRLTREVIYWSTPALAAQGLLPDKPWCKVCKRAWKARR